MRYHLVVFNQIVQNKLTDIELLSIDMTRDDICQLSKAFLANLMLTRKLEVVVCDELVTA